MFEAEGDEAGLAMAWRLLAWSAGTACRFGDAADAAERAVEHAQRASDVRQERRASTAYAGAALLGPTNVDEAIARCESCLEQTAGDRQSEGNLLAILGGLYAMQGSFDHARDLVTRGRALFEELDLEVEAARVDLEAWRVEMLAARPRRRRAATPQGVRRARRGGREVPPLDGGRIPRADARRARGDRGGGGARRSHPGARDGRRRRDAGVVAVRPRPHARPAAAPSTTPRRSPARPSRFSSRPTRR